MQSEIDARSIKLVGGHLCLDFANTVAWRGRNVPHDLLVDYEDLILWGRHLETLNDAEYELLHKEAARSPERAEEIHERAKALREAIYNVFSMLADGEEPETADMDTLNGELSEALGHVRIGRSGNGYSLELEKTGAALERVLWPIARSAADLLTSGKLDRVRRCAAEECGWLFLDTSRNRSRRWCDMKDCGNRMKARRHYRRKRELD